MTELHSWQNFYVIVGSSAGALIGLQFVVITLIANRIATPVDPQAGGAFSTPSVVHFGVVLLLSAIGTAPWNGTFMPAIVWGFIGIGGIVYTTIVTLRMRKQTVYRPVFEDWLFHVLLPFASYAILAVSAFMDRDDERDALFLVGFASLLMIFIGIHNAWDAITWHIYHKPKQES